MAPHELQPIAATTAEPLTVAIVGADGAGKTSVSRLVADRLTSAGVPGSAEKLSARLVDRWDIVGGVDDYPMARFLGDEHLVRSCTAQMTTTPRFLFLMWASAMALTDRHTDWDAEVLVLDGYWTKHAASEVAYGQDEQWVDVVTAGLPAADLVIYLKSDPETAWERLAERVVPYECGMDLSCSKESFLKHQEVVHRVLDGWAEGQGWVVVDATAGVEQVAAEAVRLVRHALWQGGGRREVGGDWTLHGLVLAQVARTPDRIAVQDYTDAWTYTELRAHTDRLARAIVAAGAGPGDRIGIHMGQSCDLVAALLAVLQVGAAYVPLEPEYPADRLAFMVADSGMALILADSTVPEIPGAHETIHVDDDGPEVVAPQVDPEATACIIYTSGSTGVPKGALLSHRGLANVLQHSRVVFGFSQGDSALALTSFSFDVSQLEILLPLVSGGAVHLADRAVARDADRFAAELANWRSTIVMGTPSLFSVMLAHGWKPAPWQRIVVGGEPVSERTAAALCTSAAAVWNAYGPTETSIHSTVTLLDPADITIGTPISGTVVEIVQDGVRCPDGEVGEIWIGGVGLAGGYLNRPGLTAERFVEDPWRPGEKLYRTGDLGLRRADKNIVYVGRMDEQVKIAGNRVELGEVEAWLTKHEAVAEAAVVAEPSPHGQQIAAHVVLVPGATKPRSEERAEGLSATSKHGSTADPAVLREFLAEFLPVYALPSRIVLATQLPRNPNGKVDRAALRTNDQPTRSTPTGTPADGFSPPTPGTPADLASIWCKVLGVPEVADEDNFFDLGGDSLGAMEVVTLARENGIMLRTSDVYQTANLGELSARIATGPEPLHLTPAQHRLLDWNYPNPHHYNAPLLLGLDRRPDADQLATALTRLSVRHPALRSRFVYGDGRWGLTFAPPGEPVPLSWHGPGADFTTEAATLQRSLNIEAGPVWRVAYFEDGDRLLLVFHHLVVDGVSLQTLARELTSSEVLPEPPPSAADHAASWHRFINTGLGTSFANRWTELPWERLESLPVHNVAGSLDAQHIRTLRTTVPWPHPDEDALIAALATALADQTGSDTGALVVTRHGRSDPTGEADVSRTVGWLNSFAPYLLDLRADITQQIRDVKDIEGTWGALRFLHDDRAVREQMARLPMPELYLNYLGGLDELDLPPGYSVLTEDVGPDRSGDRYQPYRIAVRAQVVEQHLELRWMYSADLHEPQTIEALAEAVAKALR